MRDVEPGELVRFDDRGLHSVRFAESPRRALCVFESVYLARPDSRLGGTSVHESRREMGRILAREHRVEADMVIAVPTTGHSAAQGYSEVSGLPYGDGLYKNNYVGRTFIQPSQALRDRGVKLKLNPLPDSIRGKRLVVIDDSIVRGTTTKQVVAALRESGATEVHLRITCPPLKWPCFYGIDMPTRQELIGADLTVEEIQAYVGADSLGYLSLEGMVQAAGGDAGHVLPGVLRRGVSDPHPRCGGQVRAGGSTPASHVVTSYRDAGVDIEAAAKAVTLISDLAARDPTAGGRRRARWLRGLVPDRTRISCWRRPPTASAPSSRSPA